MSDDVPEELRAELLRLDDTVAELDTIIARANELPLPEVEPVDPDVLEAAGTDPDAAPELRAVADAVAAGRTSWAEVASPGGATDLAEVRDLQAGGVQLTLRALDEQRLEQQAAPSRGRPVEDDDDFSDESIFNPS